MEVREEQQQIYTTAIIKVQDNRSESAMDPLTMEEPLGITLQYSTQNGQMRKNIVVIMRTPGHDAELAAGFLFTEGILTASDAIERFVISPADVNQIQVILKNNQLPVLTGSERNFFSNAGCGICGKSGLDAIRTTPSFDSRQVDWQISHKLLYRLPETLQAQQSIFKDTGGIHAAAICNLRGEIDMVREDVGRHNAVDKLIGAAYVQNQLPLREKILLLSGRASFELLQKAAMAGISMVASIGAPSSLAVEIATEFGITLIGFLKKNRFNIYHAPERIIL